MNRKKGICVQCGKEFEKINGRQKYCCKRCAKVVQSARQKKTRMNKISHNMIIKKCKNCGTEFYAKTNAKYCKNKCRYEYQEKSKKSAKKRSKIYSKDEQPCWTCQKACGGCSWSDNLKPVKGWRALKVTRKTEGGQKRNRIQNYILSGIFEGRRIIDGRRAISSAYPNVE